MRRSAWAQPGSWRALRAARWLCTQPVERLGVRERHDKGRGDTGGRRTLEVWVDAGEGEAGVAQLEDDVRAGEEGGEGAGEVAHVAGEPGGGRGEGGEGDVCGHRGGGGSWVGGWVATRVRLRAWACTGCCAGPVKIARVAAVRGRRETGSVRRHWQGERVGVGVQAGGSAADARRMFAETDHPPTDAAIEWESA